MTDKIFAKGIYAREIGNFGNIKVSINSAEIFDEKNRFDEKSGWGNFILKKSKNGKLYFEVDTWKPNSKNDIVDFDDIDDEILF